MLLNVLKKELFNSNMESYTNHLSESVFLTVRLMIRYFISQSIFLIRCLTSYIDLPFSFLPFFLLNFFSIAFEDSSDLRVFGRCDLGVRSFKRIHTV